MQNANSYMRLILISFPFLAIYSAGDAIFRTMGDTVTGMWLSVTANILNITGNAIFIYGMGYGAAGAAAATLIARVVCSVIFIILLHNKKRTIYIEKILHFRPNFTVIRKMLSIGVPHGIESSMFQVGRLATQVLISAMGTAAIAANSVANTLATYLYLPANSIDSAAITVVGRCYGAKETEQAKKYARMLLGWTYVCMWIVSIILFALAKPIIGIYQLSAEGASIALQLTIFHCIVTSLVRPPAFSLPAVFKATGDAKYTMVVSTISMWLVRVGLSFILAPETVHFLGFTFPGVGMGIMGVWVAMGADWVVRAALFLFRFVRGTWLHPKKA